MVVMMTDELRALGAAARQQVTAAQQVVGDKRRALAHAEAAAARAEAVSLEVARLLEAADAALEAGADAAAAREVVRDGAAAAGLVAALLPPVDGRFW